MKILTTGANGMLGTAIKKVFSNHQLILTDIQELDVRYWDIVKTYENYKPEIIFHLAAETDLEKCELDPAHAYFTNTIGVLNMTSLAHILKIPIVYISTAGVFDGKKEFYDEYDIPNPVNHYGRSKLYGESMLYNYGLKYIFRSGWMMGGGPEKDKKFVNKIFKQIKNGEKTIYALNDIFGSPTYTFDLANTIKAVIEAHYPCGIYHIAGEGIASRFDVAVRVVEYLGLQDKIKIEPVYGDYFKSQFYCPRSKSEVLKNRLLENSKLLQMRPWPIALKEYIERDFKPCL